MTDLVVRLRNINADTEEMDRMLDEAADEIERLTKELDVLFLENGKLANTLGAECLRLLAALEGIAKWSMNHDDATQRAKRALEQSEPSTSRSD